MNVIRNEIDELQLTNPTTGYPSVHRTYEEVVIKRFTLKRDRTLAKEEGQVSHVCDEINPWKIRKRDERVTLKKRS